MNSISTPEHMANFESILKINKNTKYSKRWHPTPVSYFEQELSSGAFKGMKKEIRKNIAYSLQYLQFLQLELDELNLHSIVDTQIKKSYIVTAMGIIEAVFMHLVKSNGYQKKEEWMQDTPVHSNVFKENGIDKKYIVISSVKLSKPIDTEMDFEFLINKVQEKKLLNLNHQAFPMLKALKRIRNKVHLQIVRYENDTDYMSISVYDYWLMRILLFLILRNKVFEPKPFHLSCFAFIRPKDEQIEKVEQYLKNKQEEKNNI